VLRRLIIALAILGLGLALFVPSSPESPEAGVTLRPSVNEPASSVVVPRLTPSAAGEPLMRPPLELPRLPGSEPALRASPVDADASTPAPLAAAPEVTAAPAPLPAPTTDDAGVTPVVSELPARPRVDDRRFTVRWDDEGACGEKPLAQLKASREALLASFVERRIGDAIFLHDPRVEASQLSRLSDRLQSARIATAQWIDFSPNTPPPATIVYRSTDQLRSVACVSEQTVGYYDGRLHISADPGLTEPVIEQTVVHEYVHFALNQVGVAKPMWLHEGLAMHVAEETWFSTSRLDLQRWLQTNRLPFEGMVFAFPHTADEKFALVAYYQSFRMVDFVIEHRGRAAIRALVSQLSARAMTVDDAFVQGAGLSPSTLDAQWQLFVH